MTIYPDSSFYQFDKFKDSAELSDAIDNSRLSIEECKQEIKMIICANPETFIKEKRDIETPDNNISLDNPRFWTIEKYISNKIDTLVNKMSNEIVALVHMNHLYDEWTGDNYELYKRMKNGEDVSEELEAIKHFEPIRDASYGYIINYKEDKRPSIYFKHKDFDSLYDIEDENEDCQKYINGTVSEFKMWAMMDIPALAQAGMEAKDKTKYCDDKFEFTDVVRQVSVNLNQDLDFIADEFTTLANNNIIKMYFNTQEKDD